MSHRVLRSLLQLYPRAWRARYGAELATLADELISAGDRTPLRTMANLVAGAAVERTRVLARSRRAVLATGAAVAMAVAAAGFGLAQARLVAAPGSQASAACDRPVPVPVPPTRAPVRAARAGQDQASHRTACLAAAVRPRPVPAGRQPAALPPAAEPWAARRQAGRVTAPRLLSG
jgi:hypothetical protein